MTMTHSNQTPLVADRAALGYREPCPNCRNLATCRSYVACYEAVVCEGRRWRRGGEMRKRSTVGTRVLAVLQAADAPMTMQEVKALVGVKDSATVKALYDLVQSGKVHVVGKRHSARLYATVEVKQCA